MPAESSAVPAPDLTADATFADLGVPAPLVEVLDDQGITEPFPVQAAALPDALAGRDILGRAQTGSGKTLGFSLPLVSRLAGGSTLPARPRGLVLVPTRELATQVTTVLKPLARAMGLWVTTIYGGVAYGPQVNALQHRTDIVVATPGRLADLIGQGECDLSDVEITVIDEADQMADLGFLPIVRRLLETTPGHGQRMLFSATLDAAIDVLARRFLHDPVLHSVDENSSPAEIEHHVLTVEAGNRVEVITALAGGEKRSLVFTRTKHGAERLARQLTEAGIPAAELHGNLRQGARSRNLAAFASGLARVMVATDIAARGIHIDGIDLVIHADPPADHKAYVHRSGRTARGGADGVVVTLQTKAQARDVTAMMRKAGITPHPAATVDADSEAVTEIAGPPAPRVTVGGKVAELVRPEDRLAKNDRPGVGRPWEGRPRRDRDRDRGRDRKPRGDRFRGRDAASGPAEATAGGRRDRDERPGRGDRFERADRPARFERDDRPAQSERDDRPARFERDGRPARFDRPTRDEGVAREEPRRRFERPDRLGRDDRPARNDRFDRGDRVGRSDNADRGPRGDRGERRPGDRGFAGRGSGGGFAGSGYRDRQGRGNERAGRDDRGGNDWWPSSGGRSGQAPWNRDNRGGDTGYRGNRGFGGDRQPRDERPFRGGQPGGERSGRDGQSLRGGRSFRDEAPARDERSGRDERPFRAARPQAGGVRGRAGGQPTGPRAGRSDRPQAGGRFGAPSRHAGYSAGRGAAGKRRDSGQGRHF
jgi:superfamily II DNA/RNA helicase